MPKRHQQRPAREQTGRNNPQKSTVITTGTPKKQETYHQQAIEHKDPARTAQEAQVPPEHERYPGLTHKADSRSMTEEQESRSGSESNAHKHRKGSGLHEKAQKQPEPHPEGVDFDRELRPDNLAGANYGLRGQTEAVQGRPASDIKELHTRLADLTDDELRRILILPEGSRLEQGAKYIDLQHLEQGEFVATAEMVAGPDNYYVPKAETDYVLWNRLNQVTNPARLDEPGTAGA
jgi:hypothetical protein